MAEKVSILVGEKAILKLKLFIQEEFMNADTFVMNEEMIPEYVEKAIEVFFNEKESDIETKTAKLDGTNYFISHYAELLFLEKENYLTLIEKLRKFYKKESLSLGKEIVKETISLIYGIPLDQVM